jgi:hypothetical protein
LWYNRGSVPALTWMDPGILHKGSIRVAVVTTVIQSEHLMKAIFELYHCTSLLGKKKKVKPSS